MSGLNAHGTILKVGTVGIAGAPITITTAEPGSPTICNAAAHGLVENQTVTISGTTGTGSTVLNATFKIHKLTAGVFYVDANTVGLTLTGSPIATPLAESFVAVKGCKDITLPSASTDEIDITTHDSTGKEFMDGDTDYGEVGFEINYDPAEATHVFLQGLSMSKSRVNWQAIMTNSPTPQEWDFAGWVKTFTLTAPVSGVYTATVAIRVTGSPDVT